MTSLTFPYQAREPPFFGTVTRPVLTLHLYSTQFSRWFSVRNVLVDTGADVSVVPIGLGQLLLGDVQQGQPIQLGRVVSSAAMFHGFMHSVQTQISDITFKMPVAVAMTATIPPIVDRREALDRFTIRFVKGQELILEK
jgi:hypothetical protein